jgi:ubiquinone/menaquinone biosynthesis C-methylase UbiE
MPITLSKLPEYSTITEAAGLKATQEQIARIYQRYEFCRGFAAGASVLEVACGSGIGLGFLAGAARSVVGADIDEINLAAAAKTARLSTLNRAGAPSSVGILPSNIRIARMNAHDICFKDGGFDLVMLLEAVYYLQAPSLFIGEAARVLRSGGQLIIGSVNKDWADFHPSPYTHRYYSVPEMVDLLRGGFPDVTVYGGFKVERSGLKNKVGSKIKHLALNFNLIPGSLKMRAYLKRIFIGKLVPLPLEVTDDMAPYEPPSPLPADMACSEYKIVYYVAKK